jgi:hemoglobin
MSKTSTICPVAIRNLAVAFHMRVRRDHVLAPVFARTVGTSDAAWAAHVAQTEDFWSSVMLTDRWDKRVQARFPDLEPVLFERWLSLFCGTCTDLFEPEVAVAFLAGRNRIAATLRRNRRPVA